MKKIIFIGLILFLLSLSAVSAADNTTIKTNDHTDNIQTDDITINLEKTSQSETNDGYKTYEEFKKAIETSKEGDTIKLGSNIKLEDTLDIKTNKITIDGQGHTIDGGEKHRIFYIPANYVTIQNLKLANGDWNEGAAIYVDGYLTVKKCEFTNNKAGGSGGAIYANDNNLDISDSIFKNNRASGIWGRDQRGGAICCTDLKCNNCTFEDNYSNDYGGAIYIRNGDNTEIRKSKFTKNHAEISGGAINVVHIKVFDSIFKDNSAKGAIYYMTRGGAISCSDLYCNNCTFENNYASNFGGAVNGVYGVHIQNSKFKNNKAGNTGGAIHTDGKQGEISDSQFKDNQADNGGAIYCINMNCLRSYFENNHAKDNGGAIGQKVDGDLHVININHCKFIKNTAEIDGGAVYGGKIITDSNLFLNNAATGANVYSCCGGAVYCLTMKCDKSIFENNYADDYAGAIYIKSKAESTIKNTQFKNNQAKDNNGGAIYSNGELRVSKCNYTGNKAKTDGGAIYADAKVTATQSTFTINEATGASSQCYAGAIYCTNIDCDKCIFDNNNAYDYGGAIYINNKGKSTIKNSKFINNYAKDNDGGAIYLSDSDSHINLIHNIFQGNSAGSNKGLIVYTYGYFDKISQNYYGREKPNWAGHLLYEHKYWKSNIDHKDSNYAKTIDEYNKISDKPENKTSNIGCYKTYEELKKALENCNEGDIIQIGADIKIKDTINIKAKNIVIDGQGHTITRGWYYKQIFHVTGGDNIYIMNIKFKNARSDNGGAIQIESDGKCTIINSEFDQNYASEHGGAIYTKGSLVLNNCTFKSNTAGFYGGAVYAEKDIICNKCSFENNTATNGAAIMAGLVVESINITDSKFINNSAKNDGLIYSESPQSTINLIHNLFQDNKVSGKGLCVYTDGLLKDICKNYYGVENPNWASHLLYKQRYDGSYRDYKDPIYAKTIEEYNNMTAII